MRKIQESLKKRGRKHYTKGGFTLIELIVTAAVLLFSITGLLMIYVRCLELNEISRSSTLSVQAAKARLEKIKATPFAQIIPEFDGIKFTVSGIDGIGVSYVESIDPKLYKVIVSVSWRQKRMGSYRYFGEDLNVNGEIDGGEDVNGNGKLDAPVQLVSYIFER